MKIKSFVLFKRIMRFFKKTYSFLRKKFNFLLHPFRFVFSFYKRIYRLSKLFFRKLALRKRFRYLRNYNLRSALAIDIEKIEKEESKKKVKRKKRKTKIQAFLEWTAFLSVCFVGAIWLLVHQINPNDYKEQIISSIKNVSGLDISINGELSWAVFQMYPAVELNDVKILNIPVGSSLYSINIKNVKAKVNLLSLLNGKNIISKLHIDNAFIEIKESNYKKNNLNNINLNKNNSSESNIINFDISEVFVKNSTLRIHTNGINFDLFVKDITLQHILNDSKISVSSVFYYKNRRFFMNALTSPWQDWLVKNAEIPLSLRLFTSKSGLYADVILKDMFKSFTYIGNLRIKSSNVKTLSELIKEVFPSIGFSELKSQIIGNSEFVSFRDIDWKVVNSDLSGKVEVLFKDRIKINADLKSKKLDIPKMLWPNWRTDLPHKPSEPYVGPWVAEGRLPNAFKDTPFPVDLLKSFDFKLNLKVGEIKSMPEMPLNNVNISLILNDGKFSVNDITFDYAGGKVDLAAYAHITDDNKLSATVGIDANNITVGKIVDYTGYKDSFKGGLSDGKIYLTAYGANLEEFMSTITGNFKIYSINKMVARELGNYLGGSDLLLMLVKLFATDVVREITSDNKKEPDGIFQCIVANGEINNGVYETGRGLAVETHNSNLVVNGRVDLGKENMDVRMFAFPKQGFKLSSSLAEMLYVHGNLSEPDVSISTDGILQSVGTTAILTGTLMSFTGVIGVAAVGMGILAKSLVDQITNDKNPCNTALMLDINKDLSQKVFDLNMESKKRYSDVNRSFMNTFLREKRKFQNYLKEI